MIIYLSFRRLPQFLIRSSCTVTIGIVIVTESLIAIVTAIKFVINSLNLLHRFLMARDWARRTI